MSRLRAGRVAVPVVPALLLAGCVFLSRPQEGEVFYRQASPAVVFEMLRDSPSLVILDLRTPEEYDGPLGHLSRAANLPLADLPGELADLPQRFVELSGGLEQTFIVYCRQEGDCGDRGMRLLAGRGFKFAVLMSGGIEEWIERGFGTVITAGQGGGAAEDPQPSGEAGVGGR